MAILNKKDKEEKAEAKTAKTVKSKEDTGDSYKILIKPLVTEKSFRGQSRGQVTFKVSPKANKISIRNAVEKVYDVKVARVNVVTMKGKTRNYNGRSGRTSDWKKAIVTLKPGQNIEGAQV